MIRSLLSAALVSVLAVVGIARGEVISASFTPVSVPYQVNLSEYDAFALWGTGNNGSLTANLTGGEPGFISPTLTNYSNGNPVSGRGYASPPFWDYLVNGTQIYGAIHHLTDQYSPIGEGFGLFLKPLADRTDFTVWMRSSNGTGEVEIRAFSNPGYLSTFSIGSNQYGYLSISGTNPTDTFVVSLRSTSGEAGYNGSNVLLGAVTADIVAVSEPAGLTLGSAGLACLALAFRKRRWLVS